MGSGTTMHKTLLVGGLAATNAFAMAPAAAPTMQRVSNMRVSMMAGGNFNRLEKTKRFICCVNEGALVKTLLVASS